ncbi:amidase family protein [Clostridioides difficile]|uniref:amidase family protein n=1 Tax=Clostridioides difficile TaxID=1496 RepID=UPI000C9C2CCC|nr:amidase family protein [Clostridioides difficile]
MKKKIIIGISILISSLLICAYVYIKNVIPPGEKWISYQNDKIIKSINQQLSKLDIDSIMANKEKYVVEKNIDEIQKSVENGLITYEEITAIYLYRIKMIDQIKHGYNSVVEVNPGAIADARTMDSERLKLSSQDKIIPSPLFGIPVMLKDNINTSNMPTSSGTVAFADFIPNEDANLVKELKKQGAIILGKNNLSEFANYISGIMPSGYSGKKGQTVNPFGPLKISPSGSSSGSAVSVTSNIVPISIGTETDGSIVAPASANSVVGFKPSRDKISSDGIMPLVKKIDTAGPIGKTVQDVAIAYNAISNENISLDFDINSLKGMKIGLLSYEYNNEKMLKNLNQELENMNVTVVPISLNEEGIDIINTINLSFKKDFEDFADKYNMPITKLNSLIEFNNADSKRRIKYGQNLLEEANQVEKSNMNKIDDSIQKAKSVLNKTFKEKNLDAIVFLDSSGSTMASASGYPELNVPFGLDEKGAPIGVTFMALSGEDKKVLDIGYSFEKNIRGRLTP